MTNNIPNDLNSLCDLPRLTELLTAHDAARRGSKEQREDKRRSELVEGCCLALIAGPLELGAASDTCPFRARAGGLLGDPAYDELPEAKVCRLWLSCVESSPPGDLLEQLTALADASLWEPVWALVVRTLRGPRLGSAWPGGRLVAAHLSAGGPAARTNLGRSRPDAHPDRRGCASAATGLRHPWVAFRLRPAFRRGASARDRRSGLGPGTDPHCAIEELTGRETADRAQRPVCDCRSGSLWRHNSMSL